MTQVEREEYLALDSLGLLSDGEKSYLHLQDWESAREAFDVVVEHLAYLPRQTLPAPHLKARILAALEARGSSRGGRSHLPLLMAGPFA
ncbi:MAG TPA: hypothetical protein VGD78_22325 [Chthoniobacterales bacterium]